MFGQPILHRLPECLVNNRHLPAGMHSVLVANLPDETNAIPVDPRYTTRWDDEAYTPDVDVPGMRRVWLLEEYLNVDVNGDGIAELVQVFRDRFLIADVRMQAAFPAERWFWFDPPFHPGQSVLLHKQADNVWRIDFQLGWDADPEEEKKPERVLPRVKAMLGDERPFELEWVSIYTFQCRRMTDFRHGRVLFVGDAAHQVSPFGARGDSRILFTALHC